MKTNTLMALCTCMLGAILTFVIAAAFGLTPAATAQDGDEGKNTSGQSGDYKAIAIQSGSDTEVLIVMKEVPSEHPYMSKDYPNALSMAAYTVKTNGGQKGKIHYLGTRYIDADLSIPDTGRLKLSGNEPIEKIDEILRKYRNDAAKNKKKGK